MCVASYAWCPACLALACAVTYLDAQERRTCARRGHIPVMADACSHGSGFVLGVKWVVLLDAAASALA
eukprot:6507808-Alexandrium_andersonii.AAC.1